MVSLPETIRAAAFFIVVFIVVILVVNVLVLLAPRFKVVQKFAPIVQKSAPIVLQESQSLEVQFLQQEFRFPSHPTSQCDTIYGSEAASHWVIRDEKECLRVPERAEKIRVVSVHCGNPDLITLQKKSLDAFMLEPFEYVVYDDSMNEPDISNYFTGNMTEKIKEAILTNGAEYRRIPHEIHKDRRCLFPHTIEPFTQNANVRVSNIFQFMFRDSVNFCSKARIMYMEADVFLTRPLNVTNYLKESNASVAGVAQWRGIKSLGFSFSITYIWNPILIFDLAKLPGPLDLNFDCGRVYIKNSESSIDVLDYLDTSGHLYEWLHKRNPVIKFMSTGHMVDRKEAPFMTTVAAWKRQLSNTTLHVGRVQVLDDLFIHFRNGGNWMSEGKEVSVSIQVMVEIFSSHIQRASVFFARSKKAD